MGKNTSKTHTQASSTQDTATTLGAQDKRPDAPEGPARPPRVRMNAGENLAVSEEYLDREKYSYRFFAENSIKGGRIESAKGAWWEHVTDSRGQNIKKPSGNDIMYLMKIELEYWEEDQKLKREKVRATMDQEASIGEGEYAPTVDGRPEGGTSAVNRR